VWVGGWVGGCGCVCWLYLIKAERAAFVPTVCVWVGGWVGGWVWVWGGRGALCMWMCVCV
jgi:hypothetical protein